MLALDAFSRAWVEESLLLERVVDLLEGDKRAAMTRLVQAWNARNLRVLDASIDGIAAYLAGIAVDREPVGAPPGAGASWVRERLADLRALSRAERERAMGALFDRVQVATRRLMDRLIELHEISGTSRVQVERRLEDTAIQGDQAINPTTGAIAGGAVSGLLAGLLGADVLAGGLSLGGGAILGAMLGALGGYAFGGAYRLATGGESGIQFQPAALDRLLREAVMRYLLVAHHGRGAGTTRTWTLRRPGWPTSTSSSGGGARLSRPSGTRRRAAPAARPRWSPSASGHCWPASCASCSDGASSSAPVLADRPAGSP